MTLGCVHVFRSLRGMEVPLNGLFIPTGENFFQSPKRIARIEVITVRETYHGSLLVKHNFEGFLKGRFFINFL